jgi:hypothetical protein
MDKFEENRVFIRGDESRFEVSADDLQAIFKGFRPRNLDYEDFQAVRGILKKELAHYLKGQIVHLSKVNDAVWADYTKDAKRKIKQKGHTYVRAKEESESGEQQGV